MNIEEFHSLVYLPLKWVELKGGKFDHVGYLTDDLSFGLEVRSPRMVYLHLPDQKEPQHYPNEDSAMDGATIYCIENWLSIFDQHLSERSGQQSLFANSYRLTVDQIHELMKLTTEEIEQAYILKKKGLIPWGN